MTDEPRPSENEAPSKIGRRALLIGGSLAAAGIIGYPLVRGLLRSKAAVFVAKNQRYDGALEATIRDGLIACGLDPAALRGKRVLLKPNMVEPMKSSPHMTTHP